MLDGLHLFKKGAKRFSHLVKGLVYANNENNAIKLTGIISDDNKIMQKIPRCDAAVKLETGNARLCILLDACSGYHQLKMEKQSALKTAFAAPDGRKYFYKVMPFGIVNGPTIFVIFIFDMRINWNNLAREYNIKIGPNNNTRIIIDDTYMFIETYLNEINYLRAVLEISKRYNLSWKLKKVFILPRKGRILLDTIEELMVIHQRLAKFPYFVPGLISPSSGIFQALLVVLDFIQIIYHGMKKESQN